MYDCFAFMYAWYAWVPRVCLVPLEVRASNILGLELQIVVPCCVGAGNWTLVPWRATCVETTLHLSPQLFFLNWKVIENVFKVSCHKLLRSKESTTWPISFLQIKCAVVTSLATTLGLDTHVGHEYSVPTFFFFFLIYSWFLENPSFLIKPNRHWHIFGSWVTRFSCSGKMW